MIGRFQAPGRQENHLLRIPSFRRLLARLIASSLLFVFAILCFSEADAQAVTIPGQTAVGSSAAAITVTIALPNGGTIGAVKMLGQGTQGVDFVNAGGTCVQGANFLPGQSCTVQVVFSPASPGERRGAITLLDSSRNTLATQLLTASARGSVGVFSPGLLSTVAGSSTWVYDGDGRPANASAIFLPYGIAVDGGGNLFIADSSNDRIRKVDAATGLISTIAGNGNIGSTGDNGPATAASLNNPSSITLDAAGNLYISDTGNNVVRRLDANTGIITTVAGTMGLHGYAGDHGPANHASLNNPNGIAFDANGNLYIADTGNHAVRMISAGSQTIVTVAGSGSGASGLGGDGGPATGALLNAPFSVTPAPAGGFYIADQNNSRIRFVTSSGTISTLIGTVAGFSGDGGPASQAQLYEPASVLLDVAGNLYIADAGNNRVRRVNAKTGVIDTFAGNSGESLNGDNGPANQAGLYGPYSFALDAKGNLYIADVFHNRIREVSANQAVLQFPVMRVDRVSAPLTQTLENDGNAPLNISSIAAVSNSQIDAGTTVCNAGTPLAPLDTCVVGVDFAPTSVGAVVYGTSEIRSDAGNSPSTLILEGQVLNVDPSVTTLSSSENPATTGDTIVFSVNVTSTGSTPTGNVTLMDGTTTIATTPLTSGGVASFTLSNLASGSHPLTAAYAGDRSNAASVSNVLNQVVKDKLAATATSMASSASPAIAGASITLSATVSTVTPNSGNGNIGGSIAFREGANILGVAPLNAASATGNLATASLSLSTLPVGTHTITAVYSGNSSFAGSTSVPFTQVVQLASSRIVLTTAASPSIAGRALSLTAALVSTGGIPSGQVSFLDGATVLGTATINAQGYAVLAVPGRFWTVGTHSLTAVYNGDDADGGSTSAPVAELISIAASNVTLRSSLNPAGLGASISFTAGVTTTGGTPAGSVEFFDGTISLGAIPVVATGATSASASLTTTALAIGTHTITAVYSGDLNDSPATSPSVPEIIQTATIGIALGSSANPSVFASPLAITATVTGNGSNPTGSVTLLDAGAALATLPVPANGVVQFLNPALAIGVHPLTAAYSGDINHAAVTSALLTETILQATRTSLAASSLSLIAGRSETLSAIVTGVSGRPLTGTVRFLDGGATLASVTLDGSGAATWTTTNLIPGSHVLTAAYSGDTVDAASTSAAVNVSLKLAATNTTFSTSANPILSGNLLTLSSAVTGNGGTPTGTVTFHDGGTVLTTVELTSAGTASFSLSTLAPGIHQLSASYSGDPLDGPSVSPTTAQQVARPTSVTLTSSANPSLLEDNVVLSIAVSNGVTAPTGSVVLTDNGTVLATLPLGPVGTASYTMQAPALGTHTLGVSYSGDAQNSPAHSLPLIQTVTLRPSSTSFNPSLTSISSGQQITMISVVQANGSRPATGTVRFVSGSTVLGSATVDATGLASVNVAPPEGVWATVAEYSGDALYAPSASKAIKIIVGPPIEFRIMLDPASMTLVSGAHGSMHISISTAATFTDTLALGCAGLPIDATCTFSENQIPVGGGKTKNLTVMVDTGDPLGAGPTAELASPGAHPGIYAAALPAGALLALLLCCGRRRFHLYRRLTLFGLLLLLGIGTSALSGCASDITMSHTPAASYTFQIVATGNSSAASQSATVQLTVTK